MYHSKKPKFSWILKNNQVDRQVAEKEEEGMYYVTQDGTKVGAKKFKTYEQARAYARHLIRVVGGGWTKSSNPPLAPFGYSIKSA